jgi:hypothetical protein
MILVRVFQSFLTFVGRHWIDLVYRGEFVGEPYSMIIGSNDDREYIGKEREEWKAKQG